MVLDLHGPGLESLCSVPLLAVKSMNHYYHCYQYCQCVAAGREIRVIRTACVTPTRKPFIIHSPVKMAKSPISKRSGRIETKDGSDFNLTTSAVAELLGH